MNVQTYLYFDGNCRDALDFYQAVFPASLDFQMSYRECPPNLVPEDWSDEIFHATLRIGETQINLSDAKGSAPFSGFALLFHATSLEHLESAFRSLQVGGSVKLPLSATPWADRYGIVIDRFGVTWKLQFS